MYLRRVDVEGYRAASSAPLSCEFTGRFNLLLGANGVGKTTINESIVLAHQHRFPRMAAIDAAALGLVAGQLTAALALDLLLPATGRPVGLATVGGTVLALVAVALASIRWGRAKHAAPPEPEPVTGSTAAVRPTS